MIVRESISFERGIDPKRSMDIGMITFDTIKEGDVIKSIKFDHHFVIKEILRVRYLLQLILIPFGSMCSELFKARNLCLAGKETKDFAIIKEIKDIDQWKKHFKVIQPRDLIKESLEFERGQDPKQAMGIGIVFPIAEVMFHHTKGGAHGTPPGMSYGTLIIKYHSKKKLVDYYFKRWPSSLVTVEGKDNKFYSLDGLIEKGYKYLDFEDLKIEIVTPKNGKK